MPQDPSLNGRPLQWRDLQTSQRKIISDNIRETGQQIQKTAQAHVETLRRSSKSTPGKIATAQAVADTVEPRNVTLQTAANRRRDRYNAAIEARRADNPDDPHQVIPHGAGWYFEAHGAIAKSAEQHGYDRHVAIAASGVMSPMNSPENEKAAVHAMMDAKANHTVKVTPEVHQHLAKAGIDVSEHVGKTVPIRDLPTGALSHLSDSRIRNKVETDADLVNVARGGTRQNMTRAESVLDGRVHPDAAVDPHSAPKVWSYIHNIRAAQPGTGEHVEYMGRVHHDAAVRTGLIPRDQQSLDLYGHQSGEELPKSHILSPHGHSVEDTWQNSMTFDQPNKTVPGTKTSVLKAGGSFSDIYPVKGVKTRVNEDTGKKESAHTDSRVGNASITHAFNNRASQKAAEEQGRGSGVTMSPNMIQEVGWVQVRKEAGKDPEHAARLRAQPKEGNPHAGQGVLPGMEGLINDRRKR
jgi:hypothetical protein